MDTNVYSRKLTLIREIVRNTNDPLSEPLGVEFVNVSGNEYLNTWKNFVSKIREGRVHPGISIYVHIPFCMRICNFCCLITSEYPGKSRIKSFVTALLREIGIWGSIVKDIPVSSIHIGGGTPSVLSAEQLDKVLETLFSVFKKNAHFKSGIEFHPGSTGVEKIQIAGKHKIDRISFGVQSFLADELKRSNRVGQEKDKIFQAVDTARNAGIPRINIDLLTGLPGQTLESFRKSLDFALELSPDSLTVNRTIYENTTLNSCGFAVNDQMINESSKMIDYANKMIDKLLSDRKNMGVSGYGSPHKLKELGDAETYYQEDMYCPSSVLGIGPGALHHIHGTSYSITNGDYENYIQFLDNGHYPDMRVFKINPRYEASFYTAQNIYYGNLDKTEFKKIFKTGLYNAFGHELKFLADKELILLNNSLWTKNDNKEFQFLHLFLFLLLSEKYLEESIARINKIKADHIIYPNLPEDWISVTDIRADSSCNITQGICCLVDDVCMDEDALRTVFSTRVFSGCKDIFLWTSLERLKNPMTIELFGDSKVKRIYLDISEGIESGDGYFNLPEIEIIPWLEYKGSQLSNSLKLFGLISGKGSTDGIISSFESLSLEDAEEIINFNKRNKIQLQVIIKKTGQVYQQYRKIHSEFAPSLFTCRLGFMADAVKTDNRKRDES